MEIIQKISYDSFYCVQVFKNKIQVEFRNKRLVKPCPLTKKRNNLTHLAQNALRELRTCKPHFTRALSRNPRKNNARAPSESVES